MEIIYEEIVVEEFSYFRNNRGETKKEATDLFPEITQISEHKYSLLLKINLNLNRCQFIGTMRQQIQLNAENLQEKLQLIQKEFPRSLTNELLQPIFQLLNRLVYDITEITFDEPGLKISFIHE